MAAIPYFRAMFSNFDEKLKNLLINRNRFHCPRTVNLVDYIYTAEIMVTRDTNSGIIKNLFVIE